MHMHAHTGRREAHGVEASAHLLLALQVRAQLRLDTRRDDVLVKAPRARALLVPTHALPMVVVRMVFKRLPAEGALMLGGDAAELAEAAGAAKGLDALRRGVDTHHAHVRCSEHACSHGRTACPYVDGCFRVVHMCTSIRREHTPASGGCTHTSLGQSRAVPTRRRSVGRRRACGNNSYWSGLSSGRRSRASSL